MINEIGASEWLDPRGSEVMLEAVVDHADHMKKVAGVEHLALGSDFDGIVATPGVSVTWRDSSRPPPVLLDCGYTSEEIAGILGLNFMRVFRQVRG